MADIFREVDEELRRDHAQQLWNKYGVYLIGAAVGIVVVTSIVVGWQAYTTSKGEAAALAFIEAERAAATEGADAAAIYGALVETSPAGYAALARLREAAALFEAGDKAAAIKAYEALAVESSADVILRDLAQVKAATLLVGEASFDDLAARLLPLTGPEALWRNPAREVLGLSAYREQKYERARVLFQEIVDDASATPGVRDRAHVLIALIEPRVATSGASPVERAPVPVTDAETAVEPVTGEVE